MCGPDCPQERTTPRREPLSCGGQPVTDEAERLPAVLDVLADSKLITPDEIQALQTVDMATAGLRLWSDSNRIGAALALAHAKPDVLAICARNNLVGLVYAEVNQHLKDVLPISFAFHVSAELLKRYETETPDAAKINAGDFKDLSPGVAMALATLVKNQEVQGRQFDALAAVVQGQANDKAGAADELMSALTAATIQQFNNYTESMKAVDPSAALTAAGDQLIKTVAAVGEIQNKIQAAAPAPAEPMSDSEITTAVRFVKELAGPGGRNIGGFIRMLKTGEVPGGAGAGGVDQATDDDLAAAGVDQDQPDQDADSTDGLFHSTVTVRTVQGETA